jgi:hypothetical protein
LADLVNSDSADSPSSDSANSDSADAAPDSPLSVNKGGAHTKKKSKRAKAEDALTKSLLNCPLCAGAVPCILDCK